ncbi:hypothetical protein [Aquimarina sp. SS2-1]|uniref:hypothetical protein n=1 Tax=Aquimarina besae TaxID=3342247 RepID=UPI003672A4EA
MITQKIIQNKALFLVFITTLIGLHIAWDYFNEGVPTHYVLHSKDMPGFSNWWGLLTIPISSFILLSIIQKQYKKDPTPQKLSNITNGFISGLCFGILLSVLWVLDLHEIMPYVIWLPVLVSFFIPIHYPQYLLGFILGMAYTFGGVLSIGIGTILIIGSFLIWTIFRKGVPYIFKKVF